MTETNPSFESREELASLVESILTGWKSAVSPRTFPLRSGLYAIYDRKDGDCLYVGQSRNLRKRMLVHWVWKKAFDKYDLPYFIYKIVEYEDPDQARKELTFYECLLIGLLRPQWNTRTPFPSTNYQPGENERLQIVYWGDLLDDQYEPFNKLMLTDAGYLVAKQVKLPAASGRCQVKWKRVLYDREYVKKYMEDLANQIDTFFFMQETMPFRKEFLGLESEDDDLLNPPNFTENNSDLSVY